jgi:Rps23 Pro-64 3,4-dihydroxylase Tpa1-like proline 4-hydroxylase
MKPAINSRSAEILSTLRLELSLDKNIEDLSEDFHSATPFPHLVLDNFFPAATLEALLDELPALSSNKWVHENREQFVKYNLRSATDLGQEAFYFASVLHSAAFLYLLGEITGVRALLPDPYLSGGGYHVVPEGGKFDVHADRNTDQNSGLLRRLAMLIYLNKDWKPEYGGQLELWDQEGTQCQKVVEPLFNRVVMFEIGDKNFHAVRPVTKGSGFKRRSFALYFHTVGDDVKSHDSVYLPRLYQSRDQVFRHLVRQSLPPFLFKMLQSFKD